MHQCAGSSYYQRMSHFESHLYTASKRVRTFFWYWNGILLQLQGSAPRSGQHAAAAAAAGFRPALLTWVEHVAEVCVGEEGGVIAAKVRHPRHLRVRVLQLAAAGALRLDVQHYVLHELTLVRQGAVGGAPKHGGVHLRGAHGDGVDELDLVCDARAQDDGADVAEAGGHLGRQADEVVLRAAAGSSRE